MAVDYTYRRGDISDIKNQTGIVTRVIDNSTLKNWLLNVDSLGYKIVAIEFSAAGVMTVYGQKKTQAVA